MDSKSESLLSGVNPELAARFRGMVQALATKGIRLQVTSGYRSTERQAQLYAQRSSNPNPVAPPGTSKHEKGLAVDAVPVDSGSAAVWQTIGAAARASGLIWGGDFKRPDKVHFELSTTQPTAQHEQVQNNDRVFNLERKSDLPHPALLGLGALLLLRLIFR